jgi:Short C-terminal domain
MPGLLRGVARTAVAAGTFTAVSNRVSRRQAKRWGAQDAQQQQAAPPPQQYQQAPPPQQYQQPPPPQYYQQPAPPPPPPPPPDPIAQLKELAELKNQGILTEDEFAAQKAKLLNL